MAQRIVGLIGRGTGPKVRVGGSASFEILNAETEVTVKVFWPGGGESLFQYGNGRHTSIDDLGFVQFSYEGLGQNLICNVLMES